ncbi:heme NO-binding domain-containing protein [Anaerofustis stercorihominis]|uniref:heme NO-binding domain-containing protein n=1 Tax=Anaerofustis stercorihominis TaxID=214853 RepID=UPI00214CF341|nr:heme NO-binding domain-containing protein [Anaerofustis stercorihominis]MCR2033504.1 heme NO-binding domain-containing protein [Anaerofustis stercorihominis]
MKDDYLQGIFMANKKLGILGCSQDIFVQLEKYNDEFLEDVLNALVKYTMIETNGVINKFARYDTCLGNITIYTKKGYDDEIYTNILFSGEVL